MQAPLRPRYALEQRGGPIHSRGEPALVEHLSAALQASASGVIDDLTHGFHAYPARMHPAIARELIERLSRPGDIVLDPFAGSGTVLIEALVAGRRAQGVDLSPLASRISEVQCALRDAPARARFAGLIASIAQASETRVRERAPVDVPISRAERSYYQPHVMLELAGLWAEIARVPEGFDRRALEVVFSALVVKFSRQRADTSEEQVEKRIRKGLVTEFFARKAHELVQRWEALRERAPAGAHPVRWAGGDARRLPELLGPRFRADLILSSPPYGGTYDYAHHHARRAAWLKLDRRAIGAAEIGARRNLSAGPVRGGRARWDRELGEALRAMRDVLRPAGVLVLWIGDAEVEGHRIPADEQLARLAPEAELALLAVAAQDRRDMRGGRPRREHLIALAPRAPNRLKRG